MQLQRSAQDALDLMAKRQEMAKTAAVNATGGNTDESSRVKKEGAAVDDEWQMVRINTMFYY